MHLWTYNVPVAAVTLNHTATLGISELASCDEHAATATPFHLPHSVPSLLPDLPPLPHCCRPMEELDPTWWWHDMAAKVG